MMNINDQIKDEKLQYNINREATKISVMSVITNLNILLVKTYYRLINNK